MTEPSTPLMRQYHSIKGRYPHALVLFRLGDFYELFYEDAIAASRELQITLTSRNRERGEPVPMCGVPYHAAESYIAPTVLIDVQPDAPIMQDEVFGPILPVLEIDSVDGVIRWVNSRPRPLGLYVFAEDTDVAERILDGTESGDAAINDCTIHPSIPELPFGGVGNSGMGKYHGRWGFEAFTNARGVMYHSTRIDPGVRYPPYTQNTFARKIQSKLMP